MPDTVVTGFIPIPVLRPAGPPAIPDSDDDQAQALARVFGRGGARRDPGGIGSGTAQHGAGYEQNQYMLLDAISPLSSWRKSWTINSLTSERRPVTAAAAAMAGDRRWVRAPGP